MTGSAGAHTVTAAGATRISYGTSVHEHVMAQLRELLPGLR